MSGLHSQIGKRALELLPEWERNFWQNETENMPLYCNYPDIHLAAQWEKPEKLGYYEKYCKMPNGICVPHGPVDSEWRGAAFTTNELDAEKTGYAIRYYAGKILELLRKQEITESARFAGTLGHLIQDSVVPVHSMNNFMINHLFPYRDGNYYSWHKLGDAWPFQPDQIQEKPKLLGRNVDEMVFTTTEDIFRKVEENIGTLVPFGEAVQHNNPGVADRISQQFNAGAVILTASVWHTLFCLAFNRLSPEELALFSSRSLTASKMVQSCSKQYDRQPFIEAGIPFYPTLYPDTDTCRSRLATDPYPFEPVENFAFDGKGKLIPLELLIDGKRCRANRGIATGAYGIATYRVPGKLFSELEVYAGVHPDSGSDHPVAFGIWCYEADRPLLASGHVSQKDEALHFKVSLPENCRTISLLSADGDGRTSAVWLDPKLKYRMH